MKRSNKLECTATIIRHLSDPPFIGGAFVAALGADRPDLFMNPAHWRLLFLFLCLLPAPAYLIRLKTNRFSRMLPFGMTLAGYTAAILWTRFSDVCPEIALVCRTYFLGVVILTGINLFTDTNASGHICGILGPIVLLMYLTELRLHLLLISILLLAAIIWASIYLRYHTVTDVIYGALTFLFAFNIALAFGMH